MRRATAGLAAVELSAPGAQRQRTAAALGGAGKQFRTTGVELPRARERLARSLRCHPSGRAATLAIARAARSGLISTVT